MDIFWLLVFRSFVESSLLRSLSIFLSFSPIKVQGIFSSSTPQAEFDLTMTLPLASAVAIVALILPSTQSLSIKPSPPPQPPKSLSSRSSSNVGGRSTTPARPSWNRRERSVGGRGGSSRQQQTLRAYTVADNIKPSWLSFLNFPPPFEKFASQFGSFEGMF